MKTFVITSKEAGKALGMTHKAVRAMIKQVKQELPEFYKHCYKRQLFGKRKGYLMTSHGFYMLVVRSDLGLKRQLELLKPI